MEHNEYYWNTFFALILFYFILYKISHFVSEKFSPTYRIIPEDDQVEWNSRVVSSIHAILAIYGGFLGLFEPIFMQPNFIHQFSVIADLTVASTTAYWIVDLVVILKYYKKLGEFGIIAHHIAGIIPFMLGRYFVQMQVYGCWVILSEFSTPFVNNRWFIAILQKYSPSKSLEFWEVANGLSIWASFLVCRVIMLPILLYDMYKQREALLTCYIWIWGLVLVATILVTILSYFWFFKITKGIIKKLGGSSKKSKTK